MSTLVLRLEYKDHSSHLQLKEGYIILISPGEGLYNSVINPFGKRALSY